MEAAIEAGVLPESANTWETSEHGGPLIVPAEYVAALADLGIEAACQPEREPDRNDPRSGESDTRPGQGSRPTDCPACGGVRTWKDGEHPHCPVCGTTNRATGAADREREAQTRRGRWTSRSERARKGRSRQAGSKPRPKPGTRQAAGRAQPGRAKSADEKRIAWAWANPAEAAAIVQANAAAVFEGAAGDVPGWSPGMIASYTAWLREHPLADSDGRALIELADRLGVLGAAVKRFAPNPREKDAILAAAVGGAPSVRDEDRLPAVRRAGPVQSVLPWIAEEPNHVLPIFIVGRSTGLEAGGNKQVPWHWRFWYESLLSAPLGAYGGPTAILNPTVRDLLTLAGVSLRDYRPHKHVERLFEALMTMRNMAIPYRGTAWFPAMARNVPATAEIDLETRIEIEVRLPGGTRYGPQVDRAALRSFYPASFPKLRAYLGLADYWDRYEDGKRGGATALATNPEADRWPVLTAETLRLMVYPEESARVYRTRAKRQAEAMEKAGVIEMVEAGGGWRIFRGRNR